jgi:VanZ family protein
MRGESRPLIWTLRLATAAYATALLVITHLPWVKMPPPGPSVITPDKIYHVAAYGVLGCLVALLRAARTGGTPPVHGLTVALLALLALADEVTQPLFNRVCDPLDWVFDVVGALAGGVAGWLAVVLVRRLAARAGIASNRTTGGTEPPAGRRASR